MPSHRQRASAASAETRALFQEMPQLSGADPTSQFWPYTTPLPPLPTNCHQLFHSAVLDGDSFDIAVDWQNYSFRQHRLTDSCPDHAMTGNQESCCRSHGEQRRPLKLNAEQRAPPLASSPITCTKPTDRILVLNTASEKRPGGDWEGGVLGAEESLARRSNLVQALTTAQDPHCGNTNKNDYPLPQTGGIYSPRVVVFRSGHEHDYAMWHDSKWTVVSVVSVAAIARPKLDETGTRYSFIEERDLQKEKMKAILRIAASYGHVNLVLSGFGSCGPGTGDGQGNSSGHNAIGHGGSSYKNPIRDVCKIWRELLLEDDEFRGWFKNVVFAVGGGEGGGAREFRKYFG